MTSRGKSALVLAGLMVAAAVSAPIAYARPNCQEAGVKTICQTNGSVSIKAVPGTRAPVANQPVFPWLGMPGARR
ncbi:hypothetical protein MSAR_30440 [Mycolicibacterium sarraceniae]|uniref:Uncharacterized protein n=1 Tax=Mycolicibacterium sarraceniae TaxID=1534348 RepID=A0A7I7SSW7_9MYCO|nr:hypothetical protein MSAR_30440 [Mycolicibacterium sarraceniae]